MTVALTKKNGIRLIRLIASSSPGPKGRVIETNRNDPLRMVSATFEIDHRFDLSIANNQQKLSKKKTDTSMSWIDEVGVKKKTKTKNQKKLPPYSQHQLLPEY